MVRKGRCPYRLQFLFRPGRFLADAQLDTLVQRLREAAATCFDDLPPYQVLTGTRRELSDKVLSVAWRPDGRIAGFCSTVLLPVDHVGVVLHLGLTCVRPEDRGSGLTHLLTKKVVAGTLLRRKPVGRLWVSNCAAVLSSLGNVALHFEDVFPSPMHPANPSPVHRRIGRAIARDHRDKMYVHPDAVFDDRRFVFRGSVKGTVFQKLGDDTQYHHRNGILNSYYQGLMDFENGDEVLQVGYVSTLTTVKYAYRRKRMTGRPSVHAMDLAA